MFFSPELLSRRDSGFGLLWLAATLGSQSTFKKLPKKSVLTADIKQLCDLIAEPVEPLALRLSSNLMVGVVRVYKVKQALFIVDITNCVGALKKVAQDVHSKGVSDGRLELPQAIARPAALTLAMGPENAMAIDFDALISDWDHYLNIGNELGTMDADYDPKSKTTEESKQKPKQKQLPPIETLRAGQCTLDENHDQFLTSTFDDPIDQGDGMISSYDDFAFNDPIYPLSSDGLYMNGSEDEELSRELTNAWEGCSPRSISRVSEQPFLRFDDVPMDLDILSSGRDLPSPVDPLSPGITVPPILDTRMPGPATEGRELSPATRLSRLFLSQGSPHVEEQGHNANAPEGAINRKRNRLLFDQRTELNDEELRQARAHYVQIQDNLKRENVSRCRERESGRVVETLVWNIPSGIQDQALATFWQGVFKTRVDARRPTREGERPPKRRRQDHGGTTVHESVDIGRDEQLQDDGMAVFPEPPYEAGIRGSSEDPGRARHASKGPLSDAFDGTLLGINLDTEEGGSISQKDSLFPWDHAAASSSSGLARFPLPGSDSIPFEAADIRMRRSQSRRGSSVPSHAGSGPHVGEESPLPPPLTSGGAYENYEFDVGPVQYEAAAVADPRLADLERHSSNFLEYTKMQLQAQTDPHSKLTFGDIIPSATSTRHVAAAAFYHCLVLGTKNVFHLEQAKPYGPISVSLK